MPRRIVTLLTDFGLNDHYVAAMKGAMLSVAPELSLVDITHLVEPYAIDEAAYALSQTWDCFPAGTVHLVVVDPGVGSVRRPIAIQAGGHFFVGPDNGVFTLALLKSGEPKLAHEIADQRFFRHPVSNTFHGRDIFGPVAARLATGLSIQELGPALNDLRQLPDPFPRQTAPDSWTGKILHVDRFGNLITNFNQRSFPWLANSGFVLQIGSTGITTVRDCYAAGGGHAIFAIYGSSGNVEVSANQLYAAKLLGARAGASVTLRRLTSR